MLTNTEKSPYAKVKSLPWNGVEWERDSFWGRIFVICAENTVPHLQAMFESEEISHILKNFQIAAGEQDGDHKGTPFGDGDFYKWMEAAMYAAAKTQNHTLLDQLEAYVQLIGRAQQEDGYISTKQIIGERSKNGAQRLGDINDFEVYNFGHLFTAACLYKRLTGKDSFLRIAKKAADYLEALYEEAQKTGEVKTAVCPSHYMGLIEIYRTTGEERYRTLARLSIELRDSVKNGLDDNQDRLPLNQHKKIIGHAVRANYLYAGVADLYAEEGGEEYRAMLDRVWENLTQQKIYITGGCGALYNGASPYGNFWIDQKVHQAYGYEYQLPNVTAYNETCASLGSVFWAYRMFHIEPKAEYFDGIERAMYNVNLASISLDGKKFFYENMLRRAKELPYELIWPLERKEYISSYCCPPNIARVLAQTSEYAYTLSQDGVWIGMYGASRARIQLDCGAAFTLLQETEYPWEGSIRFCFTDIKGNVPFQMHIRIPGWVERGTVSIHDREIPLSREDAKTYLTLKIEDPAHTVLKVWFDMPVRYTVSHPLVEEDTNQVAVERGPLVYCVESQDVEKGSLDHLMLKLGAQMEPVDYEIGGRVVKALEGEAYEAEFYGEEEQTLYRTLRFKGMKQVKIRMIPYFAWDNRGYGEMKIWLPIAYPFC